MLKNIRFYFVFLITWNFREKRNSLKLFSSYNFQKRWKGEKAHRSNSYPPNFRGYYYYHRGMRMFSISFRIFRENNILGQRSRGYRIELEIASRSDFRDRSGAAALFHTYRLRIIFPAVRIFIPFYFIHGLVLLSPFFLFFFFLSLFFRNSCCISPPEK